VSKLIVIGIAGKARAGKDTAASHLVNAHGFFRIALADGVRSAFTSLDGPTWELRKELSADNKNDRWAAQILGTEARRSLEFLGSVANDHWICESAIKIAYMYSFHPVERRRFVVPDIRFPREAELLGIIVRHWGGEFMSLGLSRNGSGLSGDAAKHSSETSVDSVVCDHSIVNDEGIPELFGKLDWLIHEKFEQPSAPKTELALACKD
jgi:hypothetical protein